VKKFSDDDIPVIHAFDLTEKFEKMYAEASEQKIKNEVGLYNLAIAYRIEELGKQLESLKPFEQRFNFMIKYGDE
jgi:hypothetical protein